MSKIAITSLAIAAIATCGTALADHNSKHGEGWAKMPNEIHNMRIDTLDGDNSDFTDYVRYGNGSESGNRSADDRSVRGNKQRTGFGSADMESAERTRQRTMTRTRMHAGNGGRGR